MSWADLSPSPSHEPASAEKNFYRLCLAHRRGAKRSMAIVDEAVLHSGSMATIARTATRWTEQENIESFIKADAASRPGLLQTFADVRFQPKANIALVD